jgi:hypothetical protein
MAWQLKMKLLEEAFHKKIYAYRRFMAGDLMTLTLATTDEELFAWNQSQPELASLSVHDALSLLQDFEITHKEFLTENHREWFNLVFKIRHSLFSEETASLETQCNFFGSWALQSENEYAKAYLIGIDDSFKHQKEVQIRNEKWNKQAEKLAKAKRVAPAAAGKRLKGTTTKNAVIDGFKKHGHRPKSQQVILIAMDVGITPRQVERIISGLPPVK